MLSGYVSIQNKLSGGYLCDRNTQLKSEFDYASCLFQMLPQDTDIYSIMNTKNENYFQKSIGRMTPWKNNDQVLWKIKPVNGMAGYYTIQNKESKGYMTDEPARLHDGEPSEREYWGIACRDAISPVLNLARYGFLRNKANNQYRCSNACSLKSSAERPNCMIKLIPFRDGTYGIQAQGNAEYFQSTIMHMAMSVKCDKQKWKLVEVDGSNNAYYIQNAHTHDYMTRKASQLHSGSPGQDEVWFFEPYEPETANWMGRNRNLLEDKALSKICIPASHDSGTYMRSYSSHFGSMNVTKTQYYDIQLQLMEGIRQIDLRPVKWTSDLFSAHIGNISQASRVDKVLRIGYQGAAGVPMASSFQQIKAFFENPDNQQELVVLRFSDTMDWNRREEEDNQLSLSSRKRVVDALKEVLGERLIKGDFSNLTAVPIAELLSKGNIIATFKRAFLKNLSVSGRDGFWLQEKAFPAKGGWSKVNDVDIMNRIQAEKLRQYSHANKDFFMGLSMQLTPSGLQSFISGPSKLELALTSILFLGMPVSVLFMSTSTFVGMPLAVLLVSVSALSGPVVLLFADRPSILNLANASNPRLKDTIQQWIDEGVINQQHYPNTLQTDACINDVTQAVDMSLRVTEVINGIEMQ